MQDFAVFFRQGMKNGRHVIVICEFKCFKNEPDL